MIETILDRHLGMLRACRGIGDIFSSDATWMLISHQNISTDVTSFRSLRVDPLELRNDRGYCSNPPVKCPHGNPLNS